MDMFVTTTRVALAVCFLATSRPVAGEEAVGFRQQIAPIFQKNCVRCHSANNNEGDLSLATFDDLRSNELVVPGDAEGSYLIELVTAPDGDVPAMPKEAKPLSDAEVSLLKRWIDQGANWPAEVTIHEKSKADSSWWSLQPLEVSNDQSMNSIDAFILDELNRNHLSFSPQADRRTLIRRLSFDLHGLPPTPEAVTTFVNDNDPQAYENLVDRLLASPHYGERFAQHWLDIAHYADTHGFERDKRRDNAWRYRDYVIQALNEDKPYDRFLQEQIAGDVLWPDDEQAVIATGFLAAGPWDFVGQVETKSPELRRAARALDLDDMATQVMTSTMALTVNCARCHDHKLDPISQLEYYQLQAVFAGLRRGDRDVSGAAVKQYEQVKNELIARRNKIDFEITRLEGKGLNLADIVGGGSGFGSGVFRQGLDPRNAKVQTRDFGKLGNVEANRFSVSDYEFVDGVFIPDGENGHAEIPVNSTGTTVTGLPKTSGNAWDMIRNGPVASQHSTILGGIDFIDGQHSLLGLHANAGITFDVGAMRNSLIANSEDSQGVLRFTAQLGYFGAVGGYDADAWVFVDGKLTEHIPKLKRDDGLRRIDIEFTPSSRFLTLIATDGGNGFSMDQIGFGDPVIRLSEPPQRTADIRKRLAELRSQRIEVETQHKSLGPPPKFYGVITDVDVPDIRLLLRGDPESPQGDVVSPAALQSLSMLPSNLGSAKSDEGDRRSALARWITHPDNPLTPRVIVNRLWHWHFGRGLVETPSDFGFGGGRPSHPELLDWMAKELIRQNWSLKKMHRLIVTSRAYQQKSFVCSPQSDSARKIDSDNRLLWRQNSRRLEAEAIRDSVLFVSGKLNSERGGPGFEDFEYQDAYAPIYTYIAADKPDLWRRSIYRYVVRTTPNHLLTTFDCPDPANLTPKRLTTTTPLQSLALYNNEFMLQQAEHFAERLKDNVGSDVNAQIVRAFALVFGRQPTHEESSLAIDFVESHGLFAFCRSLLNSNEFVYVD